MSKKIIVTFAVLLFLVYIVFIGFQLNGVENVRGLFTNGEALEKVYYLVQIIVGISMIIGAIVAVWQYVLTARSKRTQIANDRVEKAVKLSEYYKNNILNKMVTIRYVFEKSGVKKILDKIKPGEMKNFDGDELKTMLSKSDIEEIQKIINSKKMVAIIEEADRLYRLNLRYLKHAEEIKDNDPEIQQVTKKLMSQIVNELLNNMEYFAMHFTHNVADESVVYQSLHQTYLQIVQMSYYNIAINNKADGTQYYTNVVDLYKIWYKVQKENYEKTVQSGRNVTKGNSVKW